jgi:hypothetical protein
MGLVEYSDSESESETVQPKPAPSAAAAQKKPFQKLLDRSSGAGKIVVSLPAASATTEAAVEDEQPPAKRVKTAGGSRFSSLGSFLPPPKKRAPATPAASARKQGTAPAPGIHLRTAAEPAFVRGGGDDETLDVDGDATTSSPSLSLPPSGSKGPAGPSIPEGQKPEEEVKLVGKPLMFKPLSVARKKAPVKTKKKDSSPVTNPPASGVVAPQSGRTSPATAPATTQSAAPPPRKKISLFSMGDDEPTHSTANPVTTTPPTGTYEPIFTSAPEPAEEENGVTSAYPTYQQQQQQPTLSEQPPQQDFSSLASTLTPAARRELFGRSTPTSSSFIPPNAKVITFDMEREYAHNEALRALGAQEQLAYNPVRSIAPGKHSLRQVVNMAQSNQNALEESFARAKSNKRDAAGRYGW